MKTDCWQAKWIKAFFEVSYNYFINLCKSSKRYPMGPLGKFHKDFFADVSIWESHIRNYYLVNFLWLRCSIHMNEILKFCIHHAMIDKKDNFIAEFSKWIDCTFMKTVKGKISCHLKRKMLFISKCRTCQGFKNTDFTFQLFIRKK